MGEIKSVKVDNWGVFFLQKLQNFFNKTDYCDLTLQFNDNSQLKVHRLVLSACTDYFNVLETTCEVIDDALVMPNELQADVVVPIVNFMYTGTLEFEINMYGKLLKTARDMNMTVLLKLLEAHRRTMDSSSSTSRNLYGQAAARGRIAAPPGAGRTRIVTKADAIQMKSGPQHGRRVIPVSSVGRTVNQCTKTQPIIYKTPAGATKSSPGAGIITIKGPSRYDDGSSNVYEAPYSEAYESLPLKEEPNYDDYEQSSSSPFEQLRQSGVNYKRPATKSFESPPEKKPSIEDVKEFAEQQRMRKQIAAEYGAGDNHEYESYLDDDFPDDDEDDIVTTGNSTVVTTGTTAITIKQEPNQKPTIVVKDTSGSGNKMNHAKIIGEVLKKYPHLIKNNKNLKLKIMPNSNSSTGGGTTTTSPKVAVKLESESPSKKTSTVSASSAKPQSVSPATAPAKPISSHPRKIDSKTMHALIAQGAENTTGPWLCLKCGVNGRPISIPSYRGFRRHLINTHREKIDPRLCEHCGWKSKFMRDLHYHIQVEHKIASNNFTFPRCEYCSETFMSNDVLNKHIEESHTKNQQCIYCNEIYPKENELYKHMKIEHKERARLDGVIDFSETEDDEEAEMEFLQYDESKQDNKIKILSDISLPLAANSDLEKSQPVVPASTKFVSADGNEMVLSDEQREQIISQLDPQQDGSVVMVLNESAFPIDTDPIPHEGDTSSNKSQDGVDHSNTGVEDDQDTGEEEHVDDETDQDENSFSKKEEQMEEDLQETGEMQWEEESSEKKTVQSEDETTQEDGSLEKSNLEKESEAEREHKDENVDEKLRLLAGNWAEEELEEHQIQGASSTEVDQSLESNLKNEESDELANVEGNEVLKSLEAETKDVLQGTNDELELKTKFEKNITTEEQEPSSEEKTEESVLHKMNESGDVEDKEPSTVTDKDYESEEIKDTKETLKEEPDEFSKIEESLKEELSPLEATTSGKILQPISTAELQEQLEAEHVKALDTLDNEIKTKDELKSLISDWVEDEEDQDL